MSTHTPRSIPELIAYLEAREGQFVQYHAPMDRTARTVLIVGKVRPSKDRRKFKVRLDPMSRGADKFTADEGHASRFPIPDSFAYVAGASDNRRSPKARARMAKFKRTLRQRVKASVRWHLPEDVSPTLFQDEFPRDGAGWSFSEGYYTFTGPKAGSAVRSAKAAVERLRSAKLIGHGVRPAAVTEAAREIYDHTDQTTLWKNLGELGWKVIREVQSSGAWWIRNGRGGGNLEIMVTFGGPRKAARAFSWRFVGGPTERI